MKKPLERYIADLLYRYDLVTVPELGTFIARRRPAHYEVENETFFPPYKAVTFNARLREDDGTLTDAIARGENILRHQARQIIDRFVDTWRDQLQRSGRLYLEGLGTLAREGDKLLFTPITGLNLLPEAFGLHPVVRSKRIVEENITMPDKTPAETFSAGTVKQAPDPVTDTALENLVPDTQSGSALRLRPWMGVAAALLIGGFFAWRFLNFQGQNNAPAHPQQAGYSLHESFPPVRLHIKRKKAEKSTGQMTAPDHNPEVKIEEKPAYFLVAGAFRSEKNARRLMEKLQKDFPAAGIAGRNRKGLYLVAVEGLTAETEAQAKKEALARRGLSVWVWHKAR